MVLNGKCVCYSDFLLSKVDEKEFENYTINKTENQMENYNQMHMWNSPLYECLYLLDINDKKKSMHAMMNFARHAQVSHFFMFWLDFKEEKSLLSETLYENNIKTEELLALQLDRMFKSKLFAKDMTAMFSSNMIAIIV